MISDIALIATNCEQYNGAESELTKDARVLVDLTKKALDEVRLYLDQMHEIALNFVHVCFLHFQFQLDHCAHLERNIALVQERAKNEADMDDIWADVEENDDRNVSLKIILAIF